MDLHAYIDRLEDVVDDPVALTELRQEATADQTLSADDRELVDERIGNYLADVERAGGPLELDGPDTDTEDARAGAE